MMYDWHDNAITELHEDLSEPPLDRQPGMFQSVAELMHWGFTMVGAFALALLGLIVMGTILARLIQWVF